MHDHGIGTTVSSLHLLVHSKRRVQFTSTMSVKVVQYQTSLERGNPARKLSKKSSLLLMRLSAATLLSIAFSKSHCSCNMNTTCNKLDTTRRHALIQVYIMCINLGLHHGTSASGRCCYLDHSLGDHLYWLAHLLDHSLDHALPGHHSWVPTC